MTVNLQTFYDEFDPVKVGQALAADGFYLFESRFDESLLAALRDRIDELSAEEGTEIYYAGSEHRVWHAEEKDERFRAIQTLSDRIMPQLHSTISPSHTVLAIRNRPAPPTAERKNTRWHLDSIRRQLKLFVFLSDVTTETGPLEYIPGTHKPMFKFRAAFPLLFKPRDLLERRPEKRTMHHIHDRGIEKVRKWGYEPKEIEVPSGSVLLVETSALHRAKPCLSGERYAITVYHR